MSEALNAEPTEGLEHAAPEGEGAQGGEGEGEGQQLSADDRALAMGWTPKGQFKGDPDKWVDAETFIKRGEEFLPFLKANNKRLEQALERQSKETEKLKETLSRFSEHHSKTEARAYERAMADVLQRQEVAASIGDVQGVKDATAEIVKMETEVKAGAPAPTVDPDFKAWADANPWFQKDKPLTAATIEIANEVAAEGFTGKAQIKEVDKRVREAFPSKFTNPNRSAAAAVEGATGAARRSGKTYSDLPPDARAACDDFVKRIPGFTKDQYVKDFFS